MTSPSETTMNDETTMNETTMNQVAAEDETGMLESIPVPAEPLPTESTDLLPTEGPEPLPTESVPAESLPTESAESPAASASASLSERWHEIQAMFVDDPRSSAEMAADLVDESVQALVASVRQQQDSLLAAWHGENADTEELRTAVQHYRAFGGRLADFTG
jgi:hypothetical protein